MDCSTGNTAGCDGGSVGDAFEFINGYGTVYENDYREYDQKEQDCAKQKGSIGYKQFKNIALPNANFVEWNDGEIHVSYSMKSNEIMCPVNTDTPKNAA